MPGMCEAERTEVALILPYPELNHRTVALAGHGSLGILPSAILSHAVGSVVGDAVHLAGRDVACAFSDVRSQGHVFSLECIHLCGVAAVVVQMGKEIGPMIFVPILVVGQYVGP